MTANNKLLLLSLLISFFIIGYAPRSHASEQTVARMTTDVDNQIYHLVIDEDDTTHLLNHFIIDHYEANALKKRESLDSDSFLNEGISFKTKKDFNYAKIETKDFDLASGGIISISAIYNILTGKSRTYSIQLLRLEGMWTLVKDGQIITEIIAHANRLPVVGIVGAANLEMR